MNNQEKTNNALIEQLVYIDNFINKNEELTPNSISDMNNQDFNSRLSLDLSAFADESFIFADEDKPSKSGSDSSNQLLDELLSNSSNSLNNLPRFPVPPGAKDSLQKVGLNQNQIDLLSALIAQYQSLQHHHTATQQENTDLHNIFPQYADPSQSPVDVKTTSTGSFAFENPGSVSSTSSMDDARFSNDMDKKRRNTAASARFRIKKKLKEKQMEEKLVNLSEMIKDFESKIQHLETENKLLKKLIIEKGSEKSDNELRMLKAKVVKDEASDTI